MEVELGGLDGFGDLLGQVACLSSIGKLGWLGTQSGLNRAINLHSLPYRPDNPQPQRSGTTPTHLTLTPCFHQRQHPPPTARKVLETQTPRSMLHRLHSPLPPIIQHPQLLTAASSASLRTPRRPSHTHTGVQLDMVTPLL